MSALADILNDAADLLERDGWRQGNLGPTTPHHKGSRCGYGAILAARNGISPFPGIGTAGDAAGVVRRHLRLGSLAVWNDDPKRTADEVIDGLRGAAATA